MSPSAVHGHVTVLSNPAFFGEVVPELFPEPAFLEEGFPISTKCFGFTFSNQLIHGEISLKFIFRILKSTLMKVLLKSLVPTSLM